MDIILLQDIEKLGDKHEVVSVKPGYARNYLIPQGKALTASSSNLKTLEHLKKREELKELEKLSDYQAIADSLKDQSLKIGAKAGAEGKIFGSVTNLQIAQALQDQLQVEVERKKIELPEEVKTLGSYTAVIHFHKKIQGQIAFEVVQE